jgi:hypothetical protein
MQPVQCLIKHGRLKSVTVVNPVNRCPTVVVPAAEVERFEREYDWLKHDA